MNLVSVIVPAYNIEKYIGKCIECIINQTYQDLEIIVVDDGSTDGTHRICKLYASKDERVKVLHQSNGGLSRARNTGIEACSGEFLYFVDGDDLIHTDCIRRLVKIMEEEQCDIVQCGTYSFLDEMKIPKELPKEKHENFSGKEMCEYLLFGSKYGGDVTVVWDKLYKRSVFAKRRFDIGMLYEDVAIMYELLWNANKVTITNLSLAFYRSMRNGSITHSGNKKYEDEVKAAMMQLKFFQGVGEARLAGQSYYILSNDMARLRNYKKDQSGRLKKKHKAIVNRAKAAEMPVWKKGLLVMGYVCPKLWYYIWHTRRKITGKIKWWMKGEKV